jgi:hypothetical protein
MSDTSGTEVNNGIAQARQGLQLVRNGKAGGSIDAGASDTDRGIGMMTDGAGRVESGMNMMSNGMMRGCCNGANEVVAPMRDAIVRIKHGQGMLTDSDAVNDTDGTAELQAGCTAMSEALNKAENVMNCMGHGSMSSMM